MLQSIRGGNWGTGDSFFMGSGAGGVSSCSWVRAFVKTT